MIYNTFATLYDNLMEDVPYDSWLKFLKESQQKYGVSGNRVLDIACGTGELLLGLAQDKYQVAGVDLSSQMLSLADDKLRSEGFRVPLYKQNMAEIADLGEFDLVTIFCDSLNYLLEEADVGKTFKQVSNHLRPGGLLLFDVHSIYKMEAIFKNQSFCLNDKNISYIWESYEGDYPNSIEHDLTFFVLDERLALYDRHDEFHIQRTFPLDSYKDMLKEAGFKILEVSANYGDSEIDEETERVFFVAQKL